MHKFLYIFNIGYMRWLLIMFKFLAIYNYGQNWVHGTQTQLWLPLLVDSNQNDEVIKARVQVINYINVKLKSEKDLGFLK